MTAKAPNAYQMEQAFSALMSARARIEADEQLVDDATGEILNIGKIEGDAIALLHQTLRAAAEADVMAKLADERADTLKARRDRYKGRSEALRGAAFAAMDVLQLQRVELPDLTASIARGVPQVIVTDEAAIPATYQRVIPEQRLPDKTAIAASLKQGIAVPGAQLSNALPRLQIRTK